MAAAETSAKAGAAQGAGGGLVSGIAGRYADAFFDLSLESGALESAERDLKSLRVSIEGSPDFRRFLSSPVYDAADQAGAIAAIADKAKFGPLTKNFLALIARNRRLFALQGMIAAFFARLAEHRGEVSAEAVSATALNDDQMKRLRNEIEAKVGKAVNLATRVDPELLGGLVVKVGSTMINSSLKTKLNRLKSVMKGA